jgi:two-component system nitrogen regulation sensor histidine kinase NtrY
LVVDDNTEVLRGQRLAAWAEMARIIAHEIKNPLTPIRLSAEHMRQVYHRNPEQFGEVLERCTDNILQQVEELRVIASEFSTYSRIPRAELRADDVTAVVALLAEAYQHAGDDGRGVSFRGPSHPVGARIDRTLLTRAVRNLLENALRANGTRGKPPVELTVAEDDNHVIIRVADRGPGVPADSLARIFEPYFSTHDTGTGLGLPITRRIVEEHAGSIEARNRPGGGLEVAITMPLIPAWRAATEGQGNQGELETSEPRTDSL